jgi:hypothetical protein
MSSAIATGGERRAYEEIPVVVVSTDTAQPCSTNEDPVLKRMSHPQIHTERILNSLFLENGLMRIRVTFSKGYCVHAVGGGQLPTAIPPPQSAGPLALQQAHLL